MRNVFLILLMALFVLSCRKRTVDVPDHLLSQQEMIGFLVEVHIAEAKIKELGLGQDSAMKLFQVLEKDLMEKYGINDSIYIESYQFYLRSPDEMVKVYSAVVDSLSLRERLKKID